MRIIAHAISSGTSLVPQSLLLPDMDSPMAICLVAPEILPRFFEAPAVFGCHRVQIQGVSTSSVTVETSGVRLTLPRDPLSQVALRCGQEVGMLLMCSSQEGVSERELFHLQKEFASYYGLAVSLQGASSNWARVEMGQYYLLHTRRLALVRACLGDPVELSSVEEGLMVCAKSDVAQIISETASLPKLTARIEALRDNVVTKFRQSVVDPEDAAYQRLFQECLYDLVVAQLLERLILKDEPATPSLPLATDIVFPKDIPLNTIMKVEADGVLFDIVKVKLRNRSRPVFGIRHADIKDSLTPLGLHQHATDPLMPAACFAGNSSETFCVREGDEFQDYFVWEGEHLSGNKTFSLISRRGFFGLTLGSYVEVGKKLFKCVADGYRETVATLMTGETIPLCLGIGEGIYEVNESNPWLSKLSVRGEQKSHAHEQFRNQDRVENVDEKDIAYILDGMGGIGDGEYAAEFLNKLIPILLRRGYSLVNSVWLASIALYESARRLGLVSQAVIVASQLKKVGNEKELHVVAVGDSVGCILTLDHEGNFFLGGSYGGHSDDDGRVEDGLGDGGLTRKIYETIITNIQPDSFELLASDALVKAFPKARMTANGKRELIVDWDAVVALINKKGWRTPEAIVQGLKKVILALQSDDVRRADNTTLLVREL